jgi:beta-mannosidase
MNRLELNGSWELSWKAVHTGSLEEALSRREDGDTIPCAVPGDVHLALTEVRIIQEPLESLFSKDCRWMEEQEWWYTKDFIVAEDWIKDCSRVCFDGLDLTADIWLNGHYLGQHNNAFIPVEFAVTKYLLKGYNTLVVRIDEGMQSVKDRSVALMDKSWNTDQPYRAWMRKPQFCYGWDWTIWLPTCGIWRGVYIESYKQARIQDVFIRSNIIQGTLSKSLTAELVVSAETVVYEQGSITMQVEVYGDERYEKDPGSLLVSTEELILQRNEVFTLRLDNPELWWPNGSGKPYLYTIKITLLNDNAMIIDTWVISYGIRHIVFSEMEIGEGHKTFTLTVNGNPVFAKGANWVPIDAILGRITPGKYGALLQGFAAAHLNLIRVWGGGIYESDDFFDYCDQLGIMVWHDFMYACAYYPDYDEDFVKNINHEATTVIKRLRNRASLIGWAGNNEIHAMHMSISYWYKGVEFHGQRIFDEILPNLCIELDPDRIYRRSSPYGGVLPDAVEEGDHHVWKFTHLPDDPDFLNIWKYPAERYKFLSEFGILGPMSIESVEKCISPAQRYPGSEEWVHHHNTMLLQDEMLKRYFGQIDTWSVNEHILKGQFIQAEAMRYLYEELRSRKFECSGVLMWTYSDAFGTHGWAVVDYYLNKKPLYYYLKRALAPLGIAWKGYVPQYLEAIPSYKEYYLGQVQPLEVMIMNDHREPQEVQFNYVVMDLKGKIYQEEESTVLVQTNSTTKCAVIELQEIVKVVEPDQLVVIGEIFVQSIKVNENRYFLVPFRELKLEAAEVHCSVKRVDDFTVELSLSSQAFVWMLHLATPDGVVPMDNDFDLIPGRTRIVVVQVESASSYQPMLSGLNSGLVISMIE